MKEIELERRVAMILARQYHNGWGNKRDIIPWEEYKNQSFHNWMDAARGIIHLVRNPEILEKDKAE